MKLSAILDRFDELEAKINEPAQAQVNGVDVSLEQEQGHQVFSDVADMFESVRDRGKIYFYTFLSLWFYMSRYVSSNANKYCKRNVHETPMKMTLTYITINTV